MPFYSIESWLYQNTAAALRICRDRYRGKDMDKFEHWRAHRDQLDELLKPKTCTCLRDKHNEELAGSRYPTDAVYAVGKSFAAALDELRTNTEFMDRLRLTVVGYVLEAGSAGTE